MKCPPSFNTLRQQELRAVLWRMQVAAQRSRRGTRTGQKESLGEILNLLNLAEEASRKYPIRKEK